MVRLPFRIWGQALADYEAEALADALSAVVDKWLPVGAGKWGEEVALLAVLAMILQPRLMAGPGPEPIVAG